MIRSLSKIYTESAGAGAMLIYLVGAIVVLFSTLFAGSAAWTRTFSDAFAHLGLLDYSNLRQRRKWILGFAWFFPLAWTVLGLTLKAPIAMVMAGGVANAALLMLVAYAAYTFRYRRLPPELRPGVMYDVLLWLSFISIVAVGILALAKLFQ
jgi:manganese transport protein